MLLSYVESYERAETVRLGRNTRDRQRQRNIIALLNDVVTVLHPHAGQDSLLVVSPRDVADIGK
jgi:2-phospho-L-lactate guanylyltransferase (CobY/MobA/RfbA family)